MERKQLVLVALVLAANFVFGTPLACGDRQIALPDRGPPPCIALEVQACVTARDEELLAVNRAGLNTAVSLEDCMCAIDTAACDGAELEEVVSVLATEALCGKAWTPITGGSAEVEVGAEEGEASSKAADEAPPPRAQTTAGTKPRLLVMVGEAEAAIGLGAALVIQAISLGFPVVALVRTRATLLDKVGQDVYEKLEAVTVGSPAAGARAERSRQHLVSPIVPSFQRS